MMRGPGPLHPRSCWRRNERRVLRGCWIGRTGCGVGSLVYRSSLIEYWRVLMTLSLLTGLCRWRTIDSTRCALVKAQLIRWIRNTVCCDTLTWFVPWSSSSGRQFWGPLAHLRTYVVRVCVIVTMLFVIVMQRFNQPYSVVLIVPISRRISTRASMGLWTFSAALISRGSANGL